VGNRLKAHDPLSPHQFTHRPFVRSAWCVVANTEKQKQSKAKQSKKQIPACGEGWQDLRILFRIGLW
jgi:hypothetical protein